MSDILTAVTKAVIARLDDAGVGWDSSTGGTQGARPLLTVKVKPPDPDRIIAVTAYSRTASPDMSLKNTAISVQLWIRGAPDGLLDPESIVSSAFDALHGQHHVTWGGLVIDRCAHAYGSPMGPDDQRRWEWSENYTIVTQQRSTS